MGLTRTDWKKEIAPPKEPIGEGAKGEWPTKVQEWMTMHRRRGFAIRVPIDGEYGRSTISAVKRFQKFSRLEPTGIVDEKTWNALVAPMVRAFAPVDLPRSTPLRVVIVHLAKRFLDEHPFELRPNQGPWVRAFMRGSSGAPWAWCDGFVSTVVDHACNHVGRLQKEVLPWSASCSKSRGYAESGKFPVEWISPEALSNDPGLAVPGDIMAVVKKGSPKARHVGVIIGLDGTVLETIEGNSNDDKAVEGYELCELRRNTKKGKYGAIHFKD